ncbi:MAG: ATP-grasp domain-containing protein [Patescibacteria group bacterium]
MKPIILFRKSLAEEDELECAKKHFNVIESRVDIKQNQCIIGRYSVLPYYNELESDIKQMGGQLINSHLQHQTAQDIQNWYPYLKDLTPKTWFSLEDVPSDFDGPFFLKGRINSRKQLFKTHSIASNRKEMMDVYFRLMEDSLIQHQGVCIREYVDLVNYGINDITGCPIAKEFRVFVYRSQVVASGYYWSIHSEEIKVPDVSEIPMSLIRSVIGKIDCNFYCIDVAQKTTGEWIIVELGDGQMAGLSDIKLDEFYKNLSVLCEGE